jgi:hypothetical protein
MTSKDIHFWQGQCGCWHTTRARKTPWFYKPEFSWGRFSPVWLGGDEWCRRTLVFGWNFTGQIVIPLWYCRGECVDEDGWGCNDGLLDGGTWHGFNDPEISAGMKMHRRASELMYDGWVKFHKEVEKDED